VAFRDEIAREIAALYGFIESISNACFQPPRSAAYTDSSERFFSYITNLAEHTLRYLSRFPVEIDGSDEDFQGSRHELSEIRRVWRELHRFIKPATDADTLNQPTALIDALLKRVKQLKGFDDEDYAIFHTAEFSYLQVNPILMDRAVAALAAIVGAGSLSKPNLIGIPNSQGTALFLNCLVAHEIGHFVFEKKNVRVLLIPEIETAFAQAIGEQFQKKDLPYRSKLIDLIAKMVGGTIL